MAILLVMLVKIQMFYINYVICEFEEIRSCCNNSREFYINYVICESAVALAEKINADGVLYKLCDM